MDIVAVGDEAPTCRFCHEEGTEDAPLYYPCRCTGSIMFIHKNCLDEWLAHSNNEFCGICKEKYTYRTIFAENMPKSMPLTVTLQQMYNKLSPLLRNTVRVLFALTMWLFVLPYTVYLSMQLATNAGGYMFKADIQCANNAHSTLHQTLSRLYDISNVNQRVPFNLIHACVLIAVQLSMSILTKLSFGLVNSSHVDMLVEIATDFVVRAVSVWIYIVAGFIAVVIVKNVHKLVCAHFEEHKAEILADMGIQETTQDRPEIDDDSEQVEHDEFELAAQELMQIGNVFGQRRQDVDEMLQRGEELRQEMNRLLEDLQQIRIRLEEEQDGNVFAMMDKWYKNSGLFDLNKEVAQFYFQKLMIIHLITLLAFWMPLLVGMAAGYFHLPRAIDYPIMAIVALYEYLEKYDLELVLSYILWTPVSHAMHLLGTSKSIGNFTVHLLGASLWAKIAGIDKPIVQFIASAENAEFWIGIGSRFSDYLQKFVYSPAKMNSFYSQEIMLGAGYLICLVVFWLATVCAAKFTHSHTSAKHIWISKSVVSCTIVGVMSTVVPLLQLGISIHLSLAPVLARPPAELLVESLSSQFWTTLLWYMVVGLASSFPIINLSSKLRENTRPGLLWYLTDSKSSDNMIGKMMFKHNPVTVILVLTANIVSFAGIAVPCISMPLLLIAKSLPAVSEMHFNSPISYLSSYMIVFSVIIVLLTARCWKPMCRAFKRVFDFVSVSVAQSLRLTENVTGQVRILDEGRWSIRALPWLYIPFSRWLMPGYIVEAAYQQATQGVVDKARTGAKKGSLPTKKYYAMIQNSIDAALANTYPGLSFTLSPNNVRVPGASFVKMYGTRETHVPVNGHGRPIDPLCDYEMADNPKWHEWAKKRGKILPVSALNAKDPKHVFKKDEHRVVYLPPVYAIRELIYFFSVQLVLATLLWTSLCLFWFIGESAAGYMGFMHANDVVLIYVGYAVAAVLGMFVHWLAVQTAKIYRENSSIADKLHGIRDTMVMLGTALWKMAAIIFVFGFVLPTLIGLAKELYVSIPFAHYYFSVDPHYESDTLLRLAFALWKSNFGYVMVSLLGYTMLSDNDVMIEIVGELLSNPRQMNAWLLIKQHALSTCAWLAAAGLLPAVLAMLSMAQNGGLTADACWDLLLLRDVSALAPYIRITLLAYVAEFAVSKAVVLYKSCVEIVRERLYAVERVLDNVDGSTNAYFGTSVPASPAAE